MAMPETEYKINITRRGFLSWEYEVKRKRAVDTGWKSIKYGRMPTRYLAEAVGRYRLHLERRQVEWFKESLTINI